MADGRIEPRQVARLKEMVQWLRNYGNSIYATRGGPFVPGSWGASTRKGNTIYLHVLSWSEDVIILPPIPHRIIESSVLIGGTVHVIQTDKAIEVSVPKAQRREMDTIIALELDGPASGIAPLKLPFTSLTAGKKQGLLIRCSIRSRLTAIRKMRWMMTCSQAGPPRAASRGPGSKWIWANQPHLTVPESVRSSTVWRNLSYNTKKATNGGRSRMERQSAPVIRANSNP